MFGLDVKHPGNFKTVDYFADPSNRTELLAKLEKHPVVDDFEFLVKPLEGEPFWLLLSARVIDFEYEIALYMAFQNITDRKKKELQLFDQATRDPLTKCYNRRQFDELAKNEIQRSRRYNHPFCLFMIDADHFKNVNDTHGHAVGDLVLQALADCCRRTLRESDIIARFGGEEFVILLPEVTIENAHRVTERLRIKISKLVVKNELDQDVRFTVSIGLVSSTVTDDIPEMLKMADEALYVAKENGRNRVVVYEADGPNKDLPVPESEEIEKAKEEPLYYFRPSSELNEAGDSVFIPAKQPVAPPIALSFPAANPPMSQEGGGDEFFGSDFDPFSSDMNDQLTNSNEEKPEEAEEMPPPPENETNEDFEPESEAQAEAFPVEPPQTDEEILPEDEEDLPEEFAEEKQEEPLLQEEEPEREEEFEPPLPEDNDDFSLPAEEENLEPEHSEMPPPPMPEPLDDLPLTDEVDVAPDLGGEPLDDLPLPQEEEQEPLTANNEVSFETKGVPPPLSVTPPQPIPPAPAVSPVKVPILKKVPIKMPPGMVKMPKMPGVVRVKIPKSMHQGSAPVIPPKPGQK